VEKEEDLKRKSTAEEEKWGGRNGIEPSSPGWSPGALPWLCYSRAQRYRPEALAISSHLFCQYRGSCSTLPARRLLRGVTRSRIAKSFTAPAPAPALHHLAV